MHNARRRGCCLETIVLLQLVRNGISKITERSDVTSHPVNHILVNEETKIKSQIEISDRYKAS